MAAMSLDPANLLTACMAPLLVAQGGYVRWRVPQLPEAAGPREGRAGVGAPLSLLILGDSSAAGVGAREQSEALAGQLVGALSTWRDVSWKLWATTGHTTRDALARLAAAPSLSFDVAVVALGVNDVIRGRRLAAWRQEQHQLDALLRTKFQVRHVVHSGLPPVSRFPALPQPLRWALGARARRFDRALRADVGQRSSASFVTLDFTASLDASAMATDGFHPGPPAYAAWAERIAAAMVRDVERA